jgi:hypothetical protein
MLDGIPEGAAYQLQQIRDEATFAWRGLFMIQLTHIQSPETIDKLLKGNAAYTVMASFRRVWGKQKFSRVDLNPG